MPTSDPTPATSSESDPGPDWAAQWGALEIDYNEIRYPMNAREMNSCRIFVRPIEDEMTRFVRFGICVDLTRKEICSAKARSVECTQVDVAANRSP